MSNKQKKNRWQWAHSVCVWGGEEGWLCNWVNCMIVFRVSNFFFQKRGGGKASFPQPCCIHASHPTAKGKDNTIRREGGRQGNYEGIDVTRRCAGWCYGDELEWKTSFF